MNKILLFALAFFMAINASAQKTATATRATTLQTVRVAQPATTLMLACDTFLNIAAANSIVLYSGSIGYVTGHNTYLDKAKAEFFTTTATAASPATCPSVSFFFGIGKTLSATSSITAKIWAANAAGQPSTVLASQSVLISDIATDVAGNDLTNVQFLTPAVITGNFFAGFEMTYAAGDTVALLSNQDGDTMPGTAWEQFSDSTSTWHAMSETISWSFDLSLAVLPVVCTPNVGSTELSDGIKLYPNPSSGIFHFEAKTQLQNAVITIYDMNGKEVSQIAASNATTQTIDLSQHKKGVYAAKINDKDGNSAVYKLIVE